MAKTDLSMVCRGLACALSIAAASTMTLCRVDVNKNGITFVISHRFWGSFKFFKVMAFIGGSYNFLVIFLPNGSPLWRLVVIIDVIVNMVQASGVSAAMYTYFLLRDGNSHVKWWPVCIVSPEFCSKVLGATIAGALGLLFHFTLTCYAVYIILDPLLHYADQRAEDDNVNQ